MGRAKSIYPKNWSEVVAAVRARSGGRCECTGQCGLHRTNPGPRRCIETDRDQAIWAKGRVILTTAHLNYPGGPCSCKPLCGNLAHLIHACNRCHLRIDIALHIGRAQHRRRMDRGEVLFTEMAEFTPEDHAFLHERLAATESKR